MPGMMDTVLDVGLNDSSVEGLAKQSGDERFAWDSYRRLVQMFAKTVLGVDGSLFEQALSELKEEKGAGTDLDLGVDDLQELVSIYKGIVRKETGHCFPVSPRDQLDAAILAVFKSWNGERARIYRRQERIPDDLGTAVTVVAMVFGNLNLSSGTGVAFTRDPATGNPGVYGDYLQDAQGEDVVAGIRNTMPLQELEELNETAYHRLLDIMATLEHHYRDLCDIEFTVENGKLWMLQTRVGKRTAAAAFRIATQLVDEGVISMDEALGRVSGAGLAELMFPRFDESAAAARLTTGMGASPGAAVGKVVFDSQTAVARAAKGEAVILVRTETNPDDLPGMVAAKGILTRRGGKTSHAAVVARGMGKTCVVAAQELRIDTKARQFTAPDGTVISEGDVISIDGKSGAVYGGEVPVVPSPWSSSSRAPLTPPRLTPKLVTWSLRWRGSCTTPTPGVTWQCGPTPTCPRTHGARAPLGPPGSGCAVPSTCSSESGGSWSSGSSWPVTTTSNARPPLTLCYPCSGPTLSQILKEMDGLPVTIRLIDPPLHEFLPDLTELSVRAAVARANGEPDVEAERLLPAVRRLHEANPMLGLRGVRLCLAVPGLVELQVRAIAEAVAQRRQEGGNPVAEIMVPVVSSVQELEHVREECRSGNRRGGS